MPQPSSIRSFLLRGAPLGLAAMALFFYPISLHAKPGRMPYPNRSPVPTVTAPKRNSPEAAKASLQPWGTDCKLTSLYRPLPSDPPKEPLKGGDKWGHHPLSWMGVALIRFHQEVISPCDGPRSHFVPSSSSYSLQAIRKYGFFKGWIMTCDRLMRENSSPWVYPTVEVEDGRVLKVDRP